MRRRKSEHDAARKARRARAQQAHDRKVERFHRSVTREGDADFAPDDEDEQWMPRRGPLRDYDWLRGDSTE